MVEPKELEKAFFDKSVLITGGTGSFGSCFAKKLLEQNLCRRVIIFSRDEWKQWEMKSKDPIYSSDKIRYFLGDVRDKERLRRAFSDVQIVVHAAALKQVPAAEYNPSEFVKTNILGAMNVIDAAIDMNVEKVIALSTDKAVNPVNLYGATKLCSDKIIIAAKSYVGSKKSPLFSVVRYGNVLGSRGSLLPHWKHLLDTGSDFLPITDERMTRFWITLDQASQFVIDKICTMEGGEIFIPKSPSVRIVDLAKAFAPDVPQKICGIRPGEKINEVLLTQDDGLYSYEMSDCYFIKPEVEEHIKKIVLPKNAKKLPNDFVLASNTNPLFITDEKQITDLLKMLPVNVLWRGKKKN